MHTTLLDAKAPDHALTQHRRARFFSPKVPASEHELDNMLNDLSYRA